MHIHADTTYAYLITGNYSLAPTHICTYLQNISKYAYFWLSHLCLVYVRFFLNLHSLQN